LDPSGILPVTHVSQLSCWIPAAVPASHVAHAAPLLYVPTPQLSQAFLSVLGTCPDPHAVHIVAFEAVETFPAPQLLHAMTLVGRVNASRYFPGAQSRHPVRPAAVVYCPGSHVGQTSTSAADAVPIAQSLHAVVRFHTVDARSRYFPAMQDEQMMPPPSLFTTSRTLPTPQAMHSDDT